MINPPIKLNLLVELEGEIDPVELGRALIKHAANLVGVGINAFASNDDWKTEKRKTYIDNPGWLVSQNPAIASLVDAANVLIYGHILTLTGENPDDWPDDWPDCEPDPCGPDDRILGS